MDVDGFTAFGRLFSGRVSPWKDDLLSLEQEGATYEQWILDEANGGAGLYRVRMQPAEIYRYVSAIAGWDEFLAGGFEAVADRQLAESAAVAAQQRAEHDSGTDGVCAADFLGEHVEAPVCGWRLERAERLHSNVSPGDPAVVLHEIASALPTAIKSLTDRGDTKPSFAITDERDIQDVVCLILRSIFTDTRREEWTPSHAGGSKRIDIAIPSSRTMVEIKFVRDRRHAPRIGDELKIDIESYHSHPACGSLFMLVWDPRRHLKDSQQLERDLTGGRSKSGAQFDVVVRVV